MPKKIIIVIILSLTCQVCVNGQGLPHHDIALSNSAGGNAKVLPNAGVRVCPDSSTGTPCSPTASIFSDKEMLVVKTNPFNADVNGNYSFFILPGYYKVQVSAAGFPTFTYFIYQPFTGQGSHVIKITGVALATEPSLNFLGAGVSCVDNPTTSSTDCTFPGGLPTDATPPSVAVSDSGHRTGFWIPAGAGQELGFKLDGTLVLPPDPYPLAGMSVTCDNADSSAYGLVHNTCAKLLAVPNDGIPWNTEYSHCNEFIPEGFPGGFNCATTPPYSLPHWVALDMGTMQPVGAVGYTGRLDAFQEGNVVSHQWYFNPSTCGAGAEAGDVLVVSGTNFDPLTKRRQAENIDLTAHPTTRCIKLKILSVYDPRVPSPFAAVGSEIRVWAANVPAGTTLPGKPDIRDKACIEVRDIGVDCTGTADSSAALNYQTSTSPDSLSNKCLTFKGCPLVRLDHQWVIKSQEAPTIDLTGATVFGCNGAAGPLILVQRSGRGTITAATRGSSRILPAGGNCGAGNASNFTKGIGTDNDTAQGAYTTTAWTFENLAISGAASIAGFVGIGTTAAVNQEQFTIDHNDIYCGLSQGSVGINLASGNAQNTHIQRNNITGCMWGIKLRSPSNWIEYNQFGGNGDWDVFTPDTSFGGSTSGAAIGCWSSSEIIRGNAQGEASGAFLWGREDVVNGGCGATLEDNQIGGDWAFVGCEGTGCGLHAGHHVPIGQYQVDSGHTGNLTLKNNVMNNWTSNTVENTVPLVGTSASSGGGSSAVYNDLGTNIKLSNSNNLFDVKPPFVGFRHLAVATPDPSISTFDEIIEAGGGGGNKHVPLRAWRTGAVTGTSYTDYGITALDDVANQATNGTALAIDAIRTDPGTPVALVLRPVFKGGITTSVPASIPTPSVAVQGGGSGSIWGYKFVGVSGGNTFYTTPEITASNNATLDTSHWNLPYVQKMPGYTEYQLWLTTNPGDGRGTGMIAKWSTLASTQGCNINTTQGCDGSTQLYYAQDKGQAIVTAGSPPATNADGRITSVGPIFGPNLGSTDLPFVLESPLAADAGRFQFKLARAVTIARVSCNTGPTAGDASININLEIRSEAAPNSNGTSVLSTPLTCNSNGTASTTTILNPSVAANSPIAVMLSGSGTPGLLRVYLQVQ